MPKISKKQPPKRFCKNPTCQTLLPADTPPQRQYCTETCRKRANAQKNKDIQVERTRRRRIIRREGLGDGVESMKALAFNEMEDHVRQVLREEVRDQVGQHVKDNLLGAVEVLTDLIPRALSRMSEDLDSDDPYTYQRAYALVMKYAMGMAEKDTNKDAEGQQIILISNVSAPDTPLGRKYAEGVKELQEKNLDADLIQCRHCGESKVPAAMKSDEECRACYVRLHYKAGKDAKDWINDRLYAPEWDIDKDNYTKNVEF